MYDLLSLATGLSIALMICFNGMLAEYIGSFPATVVVHIMGIFLTIPLCLLGKDIKNTSSKLSLWAYSGGIIGVLTIVFNNLAFGNISVTSMIALNLLGQEATSISIDTLGLFGMKKHPFKKSTLIGVLFSLVGIYTMIDTTATESLLATLFCFCSGITVVLSRTANARLAQNIGDYKSSFMNFVTGLPASFVFAILITKQVPKISFHAPMWAYIGGIIGVLIVVLYNIIVPKVSAFRLTLLIFLGQLGAGIAVDIFSKTTSSMASIMGGTLVTMGLVANMYLEKHSLKREELNPKNI